jgi:PKD repeat protein
MLRPLSILATATVILISSCNKELPEASFIPSATSCEVGDTVFFQSTCQNADTYDWSFGDGTGSSEKDPSHVYTAEGDYSVILIVSNENGSDEISKTITVNLSYPCWTQLADPLEPRSTHILAVVDNRIYVIGGLMVKTVEEYDPSSDTWTEKEGIPTKRELISGCVINDKIYVIGGWDGTAASTGKTLSTLEEYDPATDTWAEKAPMPTARWGTASVAVDGKIYVIGGALDWPIKEFYTSVEIYDPETDNWTTQSPPPNQGMLPRWGFSASMVNGKVYLMGGNQVTDYPPMDQPVPSVRTVEEYDPATNTWITLSSMSTPRVVPASAAVGNRIYVFGGGSTYRVGDNILPTVEVYDVVTDTWESEPDMPLARAWLAACAIDQMIYLHGGDSGSDELYLDFHVYDTACDSE